MNNVLPVQIDEALERHVETVLAELFTVLALQLLKHGCEGTAVHQLHKDPQTVLEVESLVTLHNRVTLAHLHYANFILNGLPLSSILGLCEFQSKELSVADSHATENSSEAASALLADNLIELRRVLVLNIGCVADLTTYLPRVLKGLLRLIKLSKDNLKQGAWVAANFFFAEDAKLHLE